MIKTMKASLFALALVSSSLMAADETVTGTITLSGTLAPKATSIVFSLNDCGAAVVLAADCIATLNTATFPTTHVNTATLVVGNLAATTSTNNKRYIQFEAKTKAILFANDYLQFIAGLTSTTNNVKVSLQQLNFVKGGRLLFGQTTLGNTANNLSANEIMTSTVTDLTPVITTIWNQLVDNPGVPNEKVFFANTTGEELVVRGVLELSYTDAATSSAYSATVTAGFIAKDN